MCEWRRSGQVCLWGSLPPTSSPGSLGEQEGKNKRSPLPPPHCEAFLQFMVFPCSFYDTSPLILAPQEQQEGEDTDFPFSRLQVTSMHACVFVFTGSILRPAAPLTGCSSTGYVAAAGEQLLGCVCHRTAAACHRQGGKADRALLIMLSFSPPRLIYTPWRACGEQLKMKRGKWLREWRKVLLSAW